MRPATATANSTARPTDWPISHGGERLAGAWFYEFDVGENGGPTRHAYEIGFIFDRRPVGGGGADAGLWLRWQSPVIPTARAPIGQERPHWERWNRGAPRQMAFGESRTEMSPEAARRVLRVRRGLLSFGGWVKIPHARAAGASFAHSRTVRRAIRGPGNRS